MTHIDVLEDSILCGSGDGEEALVGALCSILVVHVKCAVVVVFSLAAHN